MPMLWGAVDHRRHLRARPAPQSTAKTTKGRSMKRSPNITKGTFNRRNCSLRTHHHARIKLSTWQRPGIETKHLAYRLNAGVRKTELGLTAPFRPNCQIVPAQSPTYKSP